MIGWAPPGGTLDKKRPIQGRPSRSELRAVCAKFGPMQRSKVCTQVAALQLAIRIPCTSAAFFTPRLPAHPFPGFILTLRHPKPVTDSDLQLGKTRAGCPTATRFQSRLGISCDPSEWERA
jgi:hypothetical protein